MVWACLIVSSWDFDDLVDGVWRTAEVSGRCGGDWQSVGCGTYLDEEGLEDYYVIAGQTSTWGKGLKTWAEMLDLAFRRYSDETWTFCVWVLLRRCLTRILTLCLYISCKTTVW